MRKHELCILMFMYFLFPVLCGGQENISALAFEETHYDFGIAKEDGGTLVHEYNFTNTGSDTVRITRIRTLCGCTRGTASMRVIPPGAKGTVKVTFDPLGYTGEQYKGATVKIDGKSEQSLTFSVNLIPRKKSVEEEYPVQVGSGLRIDKTVFNFSLCPSGQSRTLSLRFANVSGKELALEAEPVSSSGLFSVVCPETVLPGAAGEIVMTYDAAGCGAGFYSDSFILCAGESRVEIDARAVVTDDFSGLAESSPRPSMRMGGTYVNIGTIRSCSGVSRVTYKMKNEGTAPLTIMDISCPEGLSVVSLEKGSSVAPGASMSFEVLLDIAHFPEGTLFETVRILSDDPSSPLKDLMIAAKIVK